MSRTYSASYQSYVTSNGGGRRKLAYMLLTFLYRKCNQTRGSALYKEYTYNKHGANTLSTEQYDFFLLRKKNNTIDDPTGTGMSSMEIEIVMKGIYTNSVLKRLDIESNALCSILNLILYIGNHIARIGAFYVEKLLKANTTLTHLNLRGKKSI